MSRSTSRYRPRAAARRSRSVALLAAGALAGAPVLATAPALATAQAYGVVAQRPGQDTAQWPEQHAVEAGRRVVFRGAGLLGVTCAANPDLASVTVAAETTLRVVNQTGHRATLLLDGAPRGEVASASTAEVLFHRGPVSLSLKPQCMLPNESSVRVQVIPPRAEPPSPTSSPQGPRPPQPPVGAAGSPSSTDGGSGVAGRGPAGGGHGSAGDGGTGSGGSRAAGRGDASSDGVPSGRDWRDWRGDPRAGGDGVPGQEGSGSASAADSADSSAETDPFAAGAADPAAPPAGGDMLGGAAQADVAAEPMASVDPVEDEGPIGLLALISVICILGVSIAAIRAILTQRASRTRMA